MISDREARSSSDEYEFKGVGLTAMNTRTGQPIKEKIVDEVEIHGGPDSENEDTEQTHRAFGT